MVFNSLSGGYTDRQTYMHTDLLDKSNFKKTRHVLAFGRCDPENMEITDYAVT